MDHRQPGHRTTSWFQNQDTQEDDTAATSINVCWGKGARVQERRGEEGNEMSTTLRGASLPELLSTARYEDTPRPSRYIKAARFLPKQIKLNFLEAQSGCPGHSSFLGEAC